jgi:hypothetical protein
MYANNKIKFVFNLNLKLGWKLISETRITNPGGKVYL